MTTKAGTVRCAIYTRKSSEEGLEQDFNSLDAQHGACAAYILSQASEGWEQLAGRYDDGGLSGGTLERPALQRLLADVAAGQIDIIVVYKVDRLTRSLLDFSKLVEAFDRAGVSFVSVTQSFNTTTSMGRLTLNMLLSFAQFEREVTAERIRDKIAASKARGMWMGGTPPLGYRPDGRSLAIVEPEADLIRTIFARYQALGTVRRLAEDLAAQNLRSPLRTRAKSGTAFGDRPFSRGQLYAILSNPVYRGQIVHRGTLYPGQHPAIITEPVWTAVQEQLAANRQGEQRTRAARTRLLAGLLRDETDAALICSHATKGKVRYSYYVSASSRDGSTGSDTGPAIRLPAQEIEQAVCGALAELFDDPLGLAGEAGLLVHPAALAQLTPRSAVLAARLRARDRALVRGLLTAVRVLPHRFELELDRSALADLLGLDVPADPAMTFTHAVAVRLTRTGRAMRLVEDNGRAAVPGGSADELGLVRTLARARSWWKLLGETGLTIKALAAREGVTASYMTRVVRLAFLSPRITEAALAGTIRAGTSAVDLFGPEGFPANWAEQESRLLPG